ncbi:MAG: flagellar hook-associated protein FlgK [Lachnospiraceae bacterium]|nr:flagellar hook-associated protein FlgK [Lachnospiraceae bacterium]
MSAGTMGRLSIGVTALQTNQYALNTTAHNLTNTQTDGYSRQQVMLTDREYNKLGKDYNVQKAGIGVTTAEIRQVRDSFADIAYRGETGRMNYYKAEYEAVTEIENYFGKMDVVNQNDSNDFNTVLNDFWTSMQELQKESNSIVTRSSFIATAQHFLDRSKEIRSSLIEYQRNLNYEIENQINRINEIAKTIRELNEHVLATEAAKIENANDYRDARNVALDELCSLVDTEIINNADGTIEVYIEGRCLVTRGKTYDVEAVKVANNQTYQDKYGFTSDSTDFLMPVWKDDQHALFNIDVVPNANNDTDIGSLKGLMMSRGYFVSDYTDVPQKPDKPLEEDYTDPAEYQADMAQYEIDHKQYLQDLDYFNKYVEPYTITNLMAQFDVLINAMATGMNDVLCPNKEVTLSDGTTVKVLDEEAAGIGMGDGNEYAGTELFVRINQPRYTEQTLTLADGTTGTFKVYNEEDPNSFYSLYTIGNMDINMDLAQEPSLLPLSRNSGEEAQDVADKLLALWDKKFATVSPNSLVECNFKDYFAGTIDELSDRGYTYNSMAETQQQTVNDLDNLRQQVAGVSSDEELSNLVKYQHAYNAASRYITTVAEMIEHLINTLGR